MTSAQAWTTAASNNATVRLGQTEEGRRHLPRCQRPLIRSGNATQCRSYPVAGDSDAISPLGKWSLAATFLVWYPGYERHCQSLQQWTAGWYSDELG
ncbi:hypothetical protein MLGJGCBP_03304 [Rhodococcus sp. T7]|nr:hypothetical protein MLGJGCBP_03304 [Rhodococcus sp. T7]